MIHFNSLAISLLAVISIAPASQAFTPIAHPPAIEQPAANLQAQLTIIIGNPAPIPQTVVVETIRRQPEPVYRVPSRWEISRDRHEEFSRHDRFRDKHSHHRRDRDEDRREYRQESRQEHRH